MLWKLTIEKRSEEERVASEHCDGRYVLHRHHDAEGPHLDLRLEQDNYLLGWRIDASGLDEECWATEKRPHSVRWLDSDGEAVREDAGVYAWLERNANGGLLQLRGKAGERFIRIRRETGLPAKTVRSVCAVLKQNELRPEDAAPLVADGITARKRATGRLCGLGRELDGEVFDETVWRKAMRQMSLEEIHEQLRAYECRFDLKYPVQPVSRPEELPEHEDTDRTEFAMSILGDGAE